MQHLLPLYLVLCILPGIGALTVMSALASRFKNTGLILYLIAFGCLTIIWLQDLVMFYLGINISEEITPGIFALLSLNIPFTVLMQTTLPMAVHEVTRPPGKRWINGTIILISIVEMAIYYTPLVMRYSRETQTLFFGPMYPFTNFLQLLLIGYSAGMIIIRRKTITNISVRRYVLTTAIIIAVFLPAIAYDQLIFRGLKSINTVPIAVLLSPLFYAVVSLAALFFGIRFWISSANQNNGDDSKPQTGDKAPFEIILKNLADESGLSEREMTIIPLIADGLGNKQIALELHISSKTVGNHIYNIYRKLNISSRYELLALLK